MHVEIMIKIICEFCEGEGYIIKEHILTKTKK